MLKILLVEDNIIMTERMKMMLGQIGYKIIGSAIDFEEAIEILEITKPDLILLDIVLSGKKDGIDLGEAINKKYHIPFIFTTSFTDGATIERARKTNPINYLVKPFKQEQLYTAIEIAMFNLAKQSENPKPVRQEQSIKPEPFIKDALFIKEKFKYTKLPITDMLWIKTQGNYLEICLSDRREVIRDTMTAFLEKLDRKNFFRTHKSYAVNLDYLTKFEPTTVTILETKIPISKTYADELLKRMDVI